MLAQESSDVRKKFVLLAFASNAGQANPGLIIIFQTTCGHAEGVSLEKASL